MAEDDEKEAEEVEEKESKVAEEVEGKEGILDKLADKLEGIVPWGKTKLYTGVFLNPTKIIAILLSHTGAELKIKDLATVDMVASSSYASSVKDAVKTLNKKWRLSSTEVYVSLSSEQVVYKFLALPGLSGKQMEQAIHAQLKTDRRWNPKTHYLAFVPVRKIGNQMRVFACYVGQDMVKFILLGFSGIGANVYSVEPEIASFHRALHFSGMIEDRTLAHINVTPATGQLTIFTEAGVMLSRAIGGKKAGMVLDEGEEKPEEEINVPTGESFDIDIAVDDVKKTFNYYEYSLMAGEVDTAVVTGEPILLEPLGKRIVDDIGLELQDFVIDIGLDDKVASGFDPLTYGTGLGAVLGGARWT